MQSHIRRVEKFTTPIAQQIQQQQIQDDFKEVPPSSFVNVEMNPNIMQVHNQIIKMEPQITLIDVPAYTEPVVVRTYILYFKK